MTLIGIVVSFCSDDLRRRRDCKYLYQPPFATGTLPKHNGNLAFGCLAMLFILIAMSSLHVWTAAASHIIGQFSCQNN